MKREQFILSVVCLTIFAMPGFAQKVSVNYDTATDFSRYQKYAFLESKNPCGSIYCHEAILDNIQLKLAIRGLLPAYPNEKADLLIVYNAGVKQTVSIQGYDYEYGVTLLSSANDSREPELIEHAGTLVIDLVDARQNRLIWRGFATDTLVRNSESAVKRIESATKKMFAKYPPKQAQSDRRSAGARMRTNSQELPK